MLRLSIFIGTALLVGCPSTRPEPPRAADDTALRVRVAHAEARQDVKQLVELAQSTDVHARELALRGLGRVRGSQAIEALERALDDREPRVVSAALAAIGLAGSLDDLDDTVMARLSSKLAALLSSSPELALEALGRAGNESIQYELAMHVASAEPKIATAAALALGRHGRRKIRLRTDARAALAKATAHMDASVRYAATYALVREHEPLPDPTEDAVFEALAARVVDPEPETRAQAIAGLAKYKVLHVARKAIEDSLRDRDWRVVVEAVRALAGEKGDDAGRVLVAMRLGLRLQQAAKGDAGDAHIVIEALRIFLEHPVRRSLHSLVDDLPTAQLPPITRGWISCLANPTVDTLVACELPDHLRLPILAETAKHGDVAHRRAALRVLLAHDDPRVRAAGLTVLPATWNDGGAQATIIGTVTSALATKNTIVAGTAVDVAGELYDLVGTDASLRAPLDAAILARAKTETDVELAGSLYAAIGKHAIAGGADVCRAGLTGHPARAKAAADCLRALGEATATLPASIAPLPPAQPETVIGKRLVWKLATTRGEIQIELRPDTAPWAVASIVALTRRGTYDGIEFHRVVPNFVVQGGDPTMSGWGGPGYTLPAEPASSLDGPGYVAGGVGMADAGPGSAGSQWFIMHSRAAHLDGRYTWIGSVIAGQKSAEALLIGDKVDKATIEHR